MLQLLRYIRGYGKQCVLGPLFKLLEPTFELLIPLVVAKIVDVGILRGDSGYIVKMCLVMCALGIIGLVCAVTAQYFAAKAAVGMATRVRHAALQHILGLSYSQMDKLGTSTLITRLTSDINQIQNGVNLTLRLLLRSPFVVFGAMVMAFTIDFESAMVFAGTIPVLCVVVFGIMLLSMPIYKRVQSRLDGVTSATRQNLAGVRVLRAFNMEQAQIQNFENANQALYSQQMVSSRISSLLNPVTYVIINLAVVILVRIGAVKVDSGILTQGHVIALYNYMSQILVELVKMANLIITMTKAFACGNRVQKILEIREDQKDGTTVPDGDSRGLVEFRNVTMQYHAGGEPSLENVSFTAQPGQTVGIIGGTGSGKTSLVNLIPRFYDAAQGQVLVDGVNVLDYPKAELRKRIGIVPQKAVLFKGTIRQNLLWGNENATEQQLLSALETAQALEIVQNKSGGLDAEVEQGGPNFSGGQRLRLTIARALVRDPEILILDDSASALDYATDAALRKAIAQIPDAPTTFIVSQRVSSVRLADTILVLDDGNLVGMGTHEELLNACPVYREICALQLKEEVSSNG